MFRELPLKEHQGNNNLIIGFHGHYPHLAKFNPYLSSALEKLNEELDFTLRIITGDISFRWRLGRPKIKKIEFVQWAQSSISNEIYQCDIGLVPNLTDIQPFFKKTNSKKGLYKDDYFFRLKHKSNPGRMFVFIQHGVPVIADITPSHLHILGNPECGFAVFNEAGWLKSFRYLRDSENRRRIAINAKREFERLYNPLIWAKKLYDEIIRVI